MAVPSRVAVRFRWRRCPLPPGVVLDVVAVRAAGLVPWVGLIPPIMVVSRPISLMARVAGLMAPFSARLARQRLGCVVGQRALGSMPSRRLAQNDRLNRLSVRMVVFPPRGVSLVDRGDHFGAAVTVPPLRYVSSTRRLYDMVPRRCADVVVVVVIVARASRQRLGHARVAVCGDWCLFIECCRAVLGPASLDEWVARDGRFVRDKRTVHEAQATPVHTLVMWHVSCMHGATRDGWRSGRLRDLPG